MMTLDLHMTIRELLEHHPTAIKVFIERKMLCVGCPTEAYHTLEDAARIYGFTLCAFMESLREAVQTSNARVDISQIHRKESQG